MSHFNFRSSNPPPLPPKRKSQQKIYQNESDYGIDSSLLTCGLDRYVIFCFFFFN